MTRRRRPAWVLVHDPDHREAAYLRSLILSGLGLDSTPLLEHALLYFRRADAAHVVRSYLDRRDWRVVPVWA